MAECGHGKTKSRCHRFVSSNLLVLLTICGVIVGIIVGISTRPASQDVIIWIGLIGEVYMRMLKMMILPLIICSVITGTASLDPKCNGRVSVVALVFIILSNSLSCVLPMIIALTVKPGEGMKLQTSLADQSANSVLETSDIFVDLIRNLFPENIVSACFQQAQTSYRIKTYFEQYNETIDNSTGWKISNSSKTLRIKGVGTVSSTNVLASGFQARQMFNVNPEPFVIKMLQVIAIMSSAVVITTAGLVICCLIFGVASSSAGHVSKPFIAFFSSANEVIMKILRWIVWTTPAGVSSLIAVAFLQAEDLDSAVKSLGLFSLTVLSSLAIHQFILLPAVYFLLIRKNPYKFLWTLGRPWLVTFAAASSAVAIPETLTTLEDKSKIDRRITRFVVPFATTINRDGSCVFIAISCIFISQLSGADLHAGKIVLMWFLTTIISVAIPSVPSAGVVAVVINLTALGIPVDLVGLLFAAEWILDRFRSGTNMISHAHCAMVTFTYCKRYLPELESFKDETVTEIGEPMLKA